MARAILRSTDPLLPVLLATRVCPRARSPGLPTRSACEQQRRERCSGEEHVPPVVLAHLPVSVFSLSVPRGCPVRPNGAIGRPAAVHIGRVIGGDGSPSEAEGPTTRGAPRLRRGAPRIVGSSTQYGFQPAPTAIATAARLASAYMILRMCPLLLHPSPSTASTGRRLRAAARPTWLPSRADVPS